MMWEIHDDGKTRSMPEATLRKKLRKNNLSGIELVRKQGDTQWSTLYTTALYRDIVPHADDPTNAVRKRIVGPFWSHLTAFIGVLAGLWLVTGTPPSWGVFWGIGLAFHAADTMRRLKKLKDEPSAPPTTQTASSPAVVTDNEVLRAIEELGQSGWSGDTDALRQTASLLAQRRALVDEVADSHAMDALHKERDTVLADRQHAAASTQVLLDEQLSAIDARLSFLEDVRQHGIRLRVQERTLLHQVKSLRLGQIRTSEESTGPDLMQAVTRLRRELDADSEVTDALARARQAARP